MVYMAEEKTDSLNKELNEFSQVKESPKQKQEAPKKAARHKKKPAVKVRESVITVRGKRKRAIARASIVSGSGIIRVNRINADLIKPSDLRNIILEPLLVSEKASELAAKSDIEIFVKGGGSSGQAQAARSALAKAIVAAAGDESLRKKYMDYDRALLVDDYRRVEPKKFKGPKARARFQKSYR